MSSKVFSAAVIGLDAEIVEVEADTGGGELGSFTIVGLPDAAVSESRERVRSAIKNSDIDFPKLKVTVNLAPADLKKHGPSYDLPIAVSILITTKKIKSPANLQEMLFVGELALSGEVRPVNGMLSVAIKAREAGFKHIFVPVENAREAKLARDIAVIPVKNLVEIIDHLEERTIIEALADVSFDFANADIPFDMEHVRGQDHVKRAMEIAAAGGHNMLMSGPPGSGKTMLARTMPSILPDLSLDEALEITKIYSVAGLLKAQDALLTSRPFRSPHHTASGVSLVGGGTWPRPGEISLAHRGVLFLDEFGEFPRSVLENMRQPLEDGIIHVSRVAGNLTFPAKFILVAAMNPCPCGYYGDPVKKCICSNTQIVTYKKKISGPILDRIDLHVEVPRLDYEKLAGTEKSEDSVSIKARVEKARARQQARLHEGKALTNAEMSSEEIKKHCHLADDARKLLQSATERLHLSARSYFRILKIARTVADLAESEMIALEHLSEALQYRPKVEVA